MATPIDYLRENHHEFLDASRVALANPRLQGILQQLGDSLGKKNRDAWSAFPESDTFREKARAIKDATLATLDQHLETFESSVKSRGGQVHWALDGEEACRAIVKILKDAGAKAVVKSKSMTTEEIHLNHALGENGIESVETDLGEYIIQLAGHRPSHIVGPALHLSAGEVAEILSEPAKMKLKAERELLTATARKLLRNKFAGADAGITGANFAIAETGSIVLVSNEGNARLTTVMPRIHIAVVGIEKVIPKFEDLPIFLEVLARASTGQKLSVYTSILTGPKREKDLEGPDEFHVVLLDNGRTRILGGPLRESLFCIRCGACLNACPIYRSVGGHAYGGLYSGPIGAVITPLYDGLKANKHLPQASSLCGACQAACPVKIQIPEMLVKLREMLHDEPGELSAREAYAYRLWASSLRSPTRYGWLTWFVSRTLGWWQSKSGWISKFPGLKGWTASRDFPAPSSQRFRDWWNTEGKNEGKR